MFVYEQVFTPCAPTSTVHTSLPHLASSPEWLKNSALAALESNRSSWVGSELGGAEAERKEEEEGEAGRWSSGGGDESRRHGAAGRGRKGQGEDGGVDRGEGGREKWMMRRGLR